MRSEEVIFDGICSIYLQTPNLSLFLYQKTCKLFKGFHLYYAYCILPSSPKVPMGSVKEFSANSF